MRNNLYLGVFIVASLLFSCSSKVSVENVDLENWKKDRNGCLGLRIDDLENFRAAKNEFLGKDNQALLKTFGRPDKVELADRSQSFFIYYIEPSAMCQGDNSLNDATKVIFRLNAYSRVSEVTISRLDP